jgi:hypothetical protein
MNDGFAFFETPLTVEIQVESSDRGGSEFAQKHGSFVPGKSDRLEDRGRPVRLAGIANSGQWRTATLTLGMIVLPTAEVAALAFDCGPAGTRPHRRQGSPCGVSTRLDLKPCVQDRRRIKRTKDLHADRGTPQA